MSEVSTPYSKEITYIETCSDKIHEAMRAAEYNENLLPTLVGFLDMVSDSWVQLEEIIGAEQKKKLDEHVLELWKSLEAENQGFNTFICGLAIAIAQSCMELEKLKPVEMPADERETNP